MVPRFKIKQFVEPGRHYHVARQSYTPGSGCGLHDHDFCEVFWIERGCAGHAVNGQMQNLDAGTVVFIRPQDAHSFKPVGGGFTLVNVAFAQREARTLTGRYYRHATQQTPALANPWSDKQPLPFSMTVGPEGLVQLAYWSQRLPGLENDRLTFDAFMLHLHHLCTTPAQSPATTPPRDAPSWLHDALQDLAQQDRLHNAPQRLSQLADRSPEHLNRVIRKSFGCTTTDLANRVRLERAARLLSMTSRPILRIADDSGFDNLGYFYRLFRDHFGVTPRRYRLDKTAVVRA